MRDRRPAKNPLKLILWLILFVGIIYFGASGYYNFLKSAPNKNGEMVAFVVKKGESVSSIADRLESEGLIRSAMVFKYVYKTHDSAKIEAGDFKLSPAMSVAEIMDNLKQGSVDKWVTLLEGWRVEEIATKLNSELGMSKEEFLKVSKEGYMFPDTYLFNPKAKVADIASIMQNTFKTKYTDQIQSKIKTKGLSPAEGVILASIVEREARSEKVRTEVAGILLKRFKMGMALNADATVQYALGFDTKNKTWWRHVTLADYKFASPFNTYTNPGLPPTPICNPSLMSLNAVANADASTPYLFYIHDSDGDTHYAKTLEEHNRNVAKYL